MKFVVERVVRWWWWLCSGLTWRPLNQLTASDSVAGVQYSDAGTTHHHPLSHHHTCELFEACHGGDGVKMREMLVLMVLVVAVLPSQAFQPRRIKFARCSSEEKMPRAVFMTCANRMGVCEVRVGNVHNLRAIFIPDINSTDVDSHVRWNSWFEVPLPGQQRDACDGELNCPVIRGQVTRFTYSLDIQDFWPRDEYPVIWTLTDRATEEPLVCFKFKINIV